MVNVNSTSCLRKMGVKPKIWEVREFEDGFKVYFRWREDLDLFVLVGARPGSGERLYKSLSTAISDIKSIDPVAIIQLELWAPSELPED